MKKFNTIFALLFLSIGLYILGANILNVRENEELKVYSLISSNYHLFNENNYYNITYYSTMKLKEKEYYIGNDQNKILLTDYSETIENSLYNNKAIYIITVHFKLTEEINFKDAKLFIENLQYNITLEIGDYVVENNQNKELYYSFIDGHYALVDNDLRLVGITIKLDEDYTLNEVNVNDNAFVKINKILELNDPYPNILSNFKDNIFTQSIGSKKLDRGKRYFLPIGYSSNKLLGRVKFNINNIDVIYIPPIYITNPNINDYPSFIRSGFIVRNN